MSIVNRVRSAKKQKKNIYSVLQTSEFKIFTSNEKEKASEKSFFNS